MLDEGFVQTMSLTFKLAGVTTVLLLFIGVPLGYFLAFTKTRVKPIIEAVVSMPLVLPPSVLGFYMLVFFSPRDGFGKWLDETFDLRLSLIHI